MNHQPFEDWLLADEPPTGEQAIELDEHLQECPRCSQLDASWSEVHRLLQTAEQVAPAPGFTQRWQARLDAEQQAALRRRNHRQPWLLFALSFGIAVVLLALLGYQLWQTFHSTAQLLLVKAFLLSIVITAFDIGQDILSASVQVAYRFPMLQWVFLLGMSGFLGMLWITVARQLVTTRRISL